jgi:hypothetical protein
MPADTPIHRNGFSCLNCQQRIDCDLLQSVARAVMLPTFWGRVRSVDETGKVPARAWIVTFAGTAVNLCLGILYAWSVWKKSLIAPRGTPAGSPMTGLNEGWTYLTDAEATWA